MTLVGEANLIIVQDMHTHPPQLLKTLLLLCLLALASKYSIAQTDVHLTGEMRNVMWKGQLYGTIALDTISPKAGLYGLGPVEYLAGELLVMDGKCYQSTVVSDTTMQVQENMDTKAPFFAYAHINAWTAQPLPESIQTISELEAYLVKRSQSLPRPFLFRLSGTVNDAVIHIVNLPKGTKVSSPEEAHQGKTSYPLKQEQVAILGFFSTEHKAIFTHHDTFLHLHLITKDLQKMGHLDEVHFKPGSMVLYLPQE